MKLLLILGLAVTLILCGRAPFLPLQREARPDLPVVASQTSVAPTSRPTALDCFQVHQPVLVPSGFTTDGSQSVIPARPPNSRKSCSVLLMEHSFGYSYGVPYVGDYTPPSCSFNRVTMNFTVTSKGRQFDRLALMYFGDTEVWRTSTAEPTPTGIIWTYSKDMSEFLYFWKEPQKLIFDLGNLIDNTYTGYFNTTLTATFFTVGESTDPASLIIPVSARKSSSNSGSVFLLPSERAINTITLPRNANRAVFSFSACGQAAEEFWWGNVLQSDTNTFLEIDGVLPGYSPWREVQVFIDGELAGVQWPFPIIFTGGVVPGLWRPIVGIDAFDLREHEIDITPWLGLLSDGKEHTFEIKVVGINDDGGSQGTISETVGNSWYVTGKIFLWLDSASSITTGSKPNLNIPKPQITVSQHLTQDATGSNDTLAYKTHVTRALSVTSTIKTESGRRSVFWSQVLDYTNSALYTDRGSIQTLNLSSTGAENSPTYKSIYSYPVYLNSSYFPDPSGNFTLLADITRGLDIIISGTPVFPAARFDIGDSAIISQLHDVQGTRLSTTQSGSAYYFASPSTGTGLSFGSTGQEFSFAGLEAPVAEIYTRSVQAVNATIVRDKETFVGIVIGDYLHAGAVRNDLQRIDMESPRKMLGRGPN